MPEITPALSVEADQFFTAIPPMLGKVAKIAVTTSQSLVDLSGVNYLGVGCEKHRYEIRSDADVVWAMGSSGGTISTAGTVANGQSGGTLKANERVQFLILPGKFFFYGITGTGTANVEIRPCGDVGFSGAKASGL